MSEGLLKEDLLNLWRNLNGLVLTFGMHNDQYYTGDYNIPLGSQE